MGNVVILEAYKQSKEEERKRVRKVLSISNRISVIEGIIKNISEGAGTSIVTKHFDGLLSFNKEVPLDEILSNTIYDIFYKYRDELKAELDKLNNN